MAKQLYTELKSELKWHGEKFQDKYALKRKKWMKNIHNWKLINKIAKATGNKNESFFDTLKLNGAEVKIKLKWRKKNEKGTCHPIKK